MEDIRRVRQLGGKIAMVDVANMAISIPAFVVLLFLLMLACGDWKEAFIPAILTIAGMILGWTLGSVRKKNDLIAQLIAEAMKDVGKITEVRGGNSLVYRLRYCDESIEVVEGIDFIRAMNLLRKRRLGPQYCLMRVRSFATLVRVGSYEHDAFFVANDPSMEAIAANHPSEGSLRDALIRQFKQVVATVDDLDDDLESPNDFELAYGFTAYIRNTYSVEEEER